MTAMTPSALFASPRRRLLLAAGCVAALVLVTLGSQLSAALLSRWVLGLSAAAVLVWWLGRSRNAGSRFELPPRLQVVQRVGLTQRTAVALVEVDGQPYLIVHGDGFVRMRPTRKPRGPRAADVFSFPEPRGLS